MAVKGTFCNWEFNSTVDESGIIRTPDTYIHYEDEVFCEYSFYGRPGEVVEMEIRLRTLRYEFNVNAVAIVPAFQDIASFPMVSGD